jgi:hypothetical protein
MISVLILCFVQFIFRKDCKSLATFSKLKTLLLNEWCMAVDFSALIYFLQCSPVLEKLTLQLGHCDVCICQVPYNFVLVEPTVF